jgi:hypothetical protein
LQSRVERLEGLDINWEVYRNLCDCLSKTTAHLLKQEYLERDSLSWRAHYETPRYWLKKVLWILLK